MGKLKSKTNSQSHNWILTSLKISLAVLAVVFIVVKSMDLPTIVSFIVLAAFLAFAMLLMIAYMVNTGRVKAKGAKRRRKYLLPYFYKKKRSDRASASLRDEKNPGKKQPEMKNKYNQES